MINLTKAIYTKKAGSALNTYIGGRFYEDEAPDDTTYPYVVYSVVSAYTDNTFGGKYEDVMIQFSIYSTANGTTEIKTAYGYLKSLYDECALTVTGETMVWMRRTNLATMIEEHTTLIGTAKARHYAVEYMITVKV